jgi:serine protease Do
MRLLFFTALVSLTGCLSYEPIQLIPELTLSAEEVSFTDATAIPRQIDFGLTVGANESDSLFDLATLPGVRVREVVAGGAAAAAGIRPGDVILQIDNLLTNSPDTVTSLELTAQPSTFEFTVRRDTTVFATSVIAKPASNTQPPRELYRVDPIASRAGFKTQLLTIKSGSSLRNVAAATVVDIQTDSPLLTAGIGEGDAILALQGREINSAQDFINRLTLEHELGDRVVIDVYDGESVQRKNLTLWHPGRRISRVSLGPLLNYTASAQNASKSFTFIDLWLFSVYQYGQIGGERTHRLLSVFEFASDYGELIEEAKP